MEQPVNPPAGMDRSLARAVAWNTAAKWTGQILSWVSTIIVARLLTPYDYGLIGMSGVFVALATIVGQAGIEDAIIAAREVSAEQLAQLNATAIIAGAGLLGISVLAAPYVADFFAAPPLRAVVIVASCSFVISSFQIVPAALLKKALRFKLLAGINAAQVASQATVTVLLAFLGLRYWSLVYGTLLSYFVGTVLILVWQRCGFALPRWRQIRELVSYSSHVFVTQLTWFVYSAADITVAGRMLGTVPVGSYTVARQVASAPLTKITNLVTAVTPAFFSAAQDNLAELRRQFLRLSELMSLVVVPASVGIALTADYIVPVLFGSKWSGAVGPLRLLGLFFAFRSLATLPPNLLSATGDAKFLSRVSAAQAVLLPAAFVLGSRWGITGIAAIWAAVYPPTSVPIFWRVFRRVEMSPWTYFSAIEPAVSSSFVMAAAVLLVRWFYPLRPHSAAGLALLTTAGVVAYAAALLLFHRRRMRRVASGFRRLRQGAAAASLAQQALN